LGTRHKIMPLLLAVVAASSSHASLPSTATRVDPDAPCYRWPAVDWDGDGVFDRVDRCNETPKGCLVDRYGCSTDGDGDGVCDGVDLCPGTAPGAETDAHGCSAAQRLARAAPDPARPAAPPAVPASETERQLVESGRIRLENVYFEIDSAVLLPESEASLREAGEALERFPDLIIEVGGHTDTRGTARHNQQLSLERAEAVRRWLLDHHPLRRENVIARGYGESRPETRERNDEELLRNRRVILTVLNPEVLPKSHTGRGGE